MSITRHPEARFEAPPATPWDWVRDWITQAQHAGLVEPTAMNLATIDAQGRPSNRTVLFKGWDGDRVCFYTSLKGRKGQELLANPMASLCFWWDRLDRQIRFEGDAHPLSDAENDAYFASRDRGSQIGAWASEQSHPIASRAELEAKFAQVQARFDNDEPIARPPHWGGFGLTARAIEIWQGQANRFHDRVQYALRPDGSWSHQRLQP